MIFYGFIFWWNNSVHECLQICDKPLKCGSHTCPQLCHKGKCRRCELVFFEDLTCNCGGTAILSPIRCGTPAPRCNYPCTRPRPCNHVDTTPHECHFGDCPPCLGLIEKPCAGGHTVMRNIRCCREEVSCGLKCGRKLQCGDHACDRICHTGPCFEEQLNPAQDTCGRPCLAKMPHCEHLCQAICHPGTLCPESNCGCNSIVEAVADLELEDTLHNRLAQALCVSCENFSSLFIMT